MFQYTHSLGTATSQGKNAQGLFAVHIRAVTPAMPQQVNHQGRYGRTQSYACTTCCANVVLYCLVPSVEHDMPQTTPMTSVPQTGHCCTCSR